MSTVKLTSSVDKRGEVGERRGFSWGFIQTVVVHVGITSSNRKCLQDEGDELLTCGCFFPGNAVSSFKDLSL